MRKQLKIQIDPWENYLYHDAPKLVQLMAHEGMLLN